MTNMCVYICVHMHTHIPATRAPVHHKPQQPARQCIAVQGAAQLANAALSQPLMQANNTSSAVKAPEPVMCLHAAAASSACTLLRKGMHDNLIRPGVLHPGNTYGMHSAVHTSDRKTHCAGWVAHQSIQHCAGAGGGRLSWCGNLGIPQLR